ncbi:MAG: hypothetical protein MUP14_01900 [Dehalococcoidia bacterium]|nr:hypothetical protein [Dehalococcoidia bacterium]
MSRKKQPSLPPVERFEITAYRCDGGARGRRYMPPGPPTANRPLIVIDEAGVPRQVGAFFALGPPLGPPCPRIPLEHVPGCYHLNPPPAKPDAAPLEAAPTPTSRQDKANASCEPDPEPVPPPPAKAQRPQVASSAPDAEPAHVFEPELDARWVES